MLVDARERSLWVLICNVIGNGRCALEVFQINENPITEDLDLVRFAAFKMISRCVRDGRNEGSIAQGIGKSPSLSLSFYPTSFLLASTPVFFSLLALSIPCRCVALPLKWFSTLRTTSLLTLRRIVYVLPLVETPTMLRHSVKLRVKIASTTYILWHQDKSSTSHQSKEYFPYSPSTDCRLKISVDLYSLILTKCAHTQWRT